MLEKLLFITETQVWVFLHLTPWFSSVGGVFFWLGSINAIRVHVQLHCWTVSPWVQYALLPFITHCCIRNFPGQIYTSSIKETLGMFVCLGPSLLGHKQLLLAVFLIWIDSFCWHYLDWSPSIMVQNSTLQHYTLYKPSNLFECVKDLHKLCCNNNNSTLPAIREKYSQHKVNKDWVHQMFDKCDNIVINITRLNTTNMILNSL